MTRRDVREGATRTTANDTNIPELVRDVLDWPAFGKTETKLAQRSPSRKERNYRAAGVHEDEEDDRIDTVGTTESFFAS